jgi:hypothetical protein
MVITIIPIILLIDIEAKLKAMVTQVNHGESAP